VKRKGGARFLFVIGVARIWEEKTRGGGSSITLLPKKKEKKGVVLRSETFHAWGAPQAQSGRPVLRELLSYNRRGYSEKSGFIREPKKSSQVPERGRP